MGARVATAASRRHGREPARAGRQRRFAVVRGPHPRDDGHAGPVQQTNCHPFRHRNWLLVHNGVIDGFEQMRRELMLAVDPSLYGDVAGSTDSETLFYLALTFGVTEDPLAGLERAVGLVASSYGIDHPVQMTIGMSNGERLWAVRYSSEGRSRTLFVSADAAALRALHPERERLQQLGDEDRSVVSEPLGDLPGAWLEVPESTALIIQPGPHEQRPFCPRAPEAVAA